MDLIELAVVRDSELKTGMRALLAYAMHKGFWTILNVLFTQAADKLTPRLLKEKFTEIVVFHLIYKLMESHSPEEPNSLLGSETAKKLSQLKDPERLGELGVDEKSAHGGIGRAKRSGKPANPQCRPVINP